MGKLGDGGKYQSTAKNLLIFPSRKILFSSSPYTCFICSCSHCCCIIFFKFRLYMYAQTMLILINQCLLIVVFSITKALNGQISPKYHFYYPHLSVLFGNSASLNACFPLFHTTFFILHFMKFQLTPFQLEHCGLFPNQIWWISKLVGINQMKFLI